MTTQPGPQGDLATSIGRSAGLANKSALPGGGRLAPGVDGGIGVALDTSGDTTNVDRAQPQAEPFTPESAGKGKGKGKACKPGYHKNAQGKCVKNVGQKAKGPATADTTGDNGPPGDFNINLGKGQQPTTGSTGSSGGGSSAPPPDPNAPLINAAAGMYLSLWGQVPPAGYIQKLVKAGMNLFEIELNERSKLAFKRTQTYRDEAAQFAATRDHILGYR